MKSVILEVDIVRGQLDVGRLLPHRTQLHDQIESIDRFFLRTRHWGGGGGFVRIRDAAAAGEASYLVLQN